MKRTVVLLLLATIFAASFASYAAPPDWPAEVEDRYDFIDSIDWLDALDDPDELFPVCKDGLWGFIDRSGTEIVPLIYDFTTYIGDGFGLVQKGEKTGFVDKTGKLIVPVEYEYDGASYLSNGIFALRKGWFWGIIDISGKELAPFIYDEIGLYSEGMVMVVLDGKVGFVNTMGGQDIPPQYDIVEGPCGCWSFVFSGGLAAVSLDGKWGYIRTDGSVAIAFLYEGAEMFSEGLACVAMGGMWGFIDTAGKVVIPFEYDPIGTEYGVDFGTGFFYGGEAYVRKNGLLGYIDRTGKALRGFIYEEYYEYAFNYYIGDNPGPLSGYAMAKQSGKWGVVHKETQEVAIPFMYDELFYDRSPDVAHIGVALGGKQGFVDIHNNIIFPIIIEELYGSSYGGLTKYAANGRYGFMDMHHSPAIEPRFDEAMNFSSGLAAVRLGRHWGYIDKAGNVVIGLEYDGAKEYSEGLACVNKYGLWGFVNAAGETVIPFQFSGGAVFLGGVAYIYSYYYVTAIDKKGNVIGKYPVGQFWEDGGEGNTGYENPDKVSDWVKAEGVFYVPREFDYRYQAPMTRAEACRLLTWLYPNLTDGKYLPYPKTDPFRDTDDVDVRQAYEAGIVSGTGNGKFAPDRRITRQDFAVILFKLMKFSGAKIEIESPLPFSDGNDVADYALEAVSAMASKDILRGSNGKFNPNGPLTREQAMVCAQRVKKFVTGNKYWAEYY